MASSFGGEAEGKKVFKENVNVFSYSGLSRQNQQMSSVGTILQTRIKSQTFEDICLKLQI